MHPPRELLEVRCFEVPKEDAARRILRLDVVGFHVAR
jgi:hypothetical protein